MTKVLYSADILLDFPKSSLGDVFYGILNLMNKRRRKESQTFYLLKYLRSSSLQGSPSGQLRDPLPRTAQILFSVICGSSQFSRCAIDKHCLFCACVRVFCLRCGRDGASECASVTANRRPGNPAAGRDLATPPGVLCWSFYYPSITSERHCKIKYI